MKKLILLLLCAVSSFSLAATQASDGSNLRDSIFRIYRSMPAYVPTTRIVCPYRNLCRKLSAMSP